MFVVFDLDGTLALNDHRVHYVRQQPRDWRAFFAACVYDPVNFPAMQALRAHRAVGHAVEIWSGRSDEVRTQTLAWLGALDPALPAVLTRMRRAGDHRQDVDLKRSWLREARAAGRAPDLVYDDRDCVVAMWRGQGVPCFQVAPGPF